MKKQGKSYWHSIHNSRIAILGIVPPPFGGVSVHIYRVMDCFSLQNNKLFFWPTEQRGRKLLPLYLVRLGWHLFVYRPHHVYYHSTYLTTSSMELVFLVFIRWLLVCQIHIVDHDCRHLYRRGSIAKRLYRWLAQRIDSIVCIGESTYKSYIAHDIKSANITIDEAFIPPIKRNASLIMQTYPSSLSLFMKEHTPLLLVGAAHLMRNEGKDMYGIDTAMYILAQIQHEYPDAGLIIGLPQIGDKNYFYFLQQLMRQWHIAEFIYVVLNNKEIWPLFERVDIFLRPTLTDGDSISIKEALYFNVPVVASDVCQRPNGVHCFKTNDRDNAVLITKKILRDYVYGPHRQRDHLYTQSK